MKKFLIDTHSFLWYLDGNKNLSAFAINEITNANNTIYISIASIWELGIKLSLGKLKLDGSIEDLKNEIIKNNFEILPLDFEHIIELTKLEHHHKDPFDRILISQAAVEKLIVISKDANFKYYRNIEVF